MVSPLFEIPGQDLFASQGADYSGLLLLVAAFFFLLLFSRNLRNIDERISAYTEIRHWLVAEQSIIGSANICHR
jgi:hypothetical protein